MASEAPITAARPNADAPVPPASSSAGAPDDYVSWPARLVAAVRTRWRLTAAIFVALVALGSWYVVTTPTTYASTGVISFQPRLEESNGRDLIALLAARYPAVIASTSSVASAATAAGVSSEQVSSGLTATVEPSTLNMLFTVTLGTSQQAQSAAQSLYLSTLQYNETDPFLEALKVETPTPAVAVAGVPKVALLGAVLLLAALVAAMSALVVGQLSGRE